MIEKATNILEEMVFQADIIDSFARRGWGLYQADGIRFDIMHLDALKAVVSMGRGKHALEHFKSYIMLPLAKKDDDWNVVYSLIKEVLSKGRGPFFVDIVEKDDYVETIGVYLIDCVILEPPFLYLVIDTRLSKIFKEENHLKRGAVEIHLSELWKIRKQTMLSLRK